MAEAEDRFTHAGEPEDADERRREAERRCLDAEQRCFQAERRRFEAERRREEVEGLLAEARRAGANMERIVAELRRLVAELRGAAARPRVSSGETAGGDASPSDDDMVDALTTAIARLRANVQAVGESGGSTAPSGGSEASTSPGPDLPRVALAEAVPVRPPHKHSMSWIARWRARRKQRR